MGEIDLMYEEGSAVGSVDLAAVKEHASSMAKRSGQPHIQFDESYLRELEKCHGGRPRKNTFTTPGGDVRTIGRFFNYLNREDVTPPQEVSWRNNSCDIRLDYSVPYLESVISNWEERDDLIPFAGMDDCEEMCEYDLLCFDFREPGRPRIVIWDIRESIFMEDDKLELEAVANNFDEFLGMLRLPDESSSD